MTHLTLLFVLQEYVDGLQLKYNKLLVKSAVLFSFPFWCINTLVALLSAVRKPKALRSVDLNRELICVYGCVQFTPALHLHVSHRPDHRPFTIENLMGVEI